MHRLIVRRLRRDPSLVEKAKVAHARQAVQFADWPFVREWQDLLALPVGELASKLISREREMVRLRNPPLSVSEKGAILASWGIRRVGDCFLPFAAGARRPQGPRHH
jgi:hypothetical protein